MQNQKCKTLAGNPSAWDKEMTEWRAKYPGDENLCKMQISQWQRGRRDATIVETIYGFSVRMTSGLSGMAFIPNGRRLNTYEEAVQVGTEWANQDPDNREFWVYQ